MASRERGEVLAEAFYAWERRGRGWQVWAQPVELDPPYRHCFVPSRVAALVPDEDDGRHSTFLSRLTDRMLGLTPPPRTTEAEARTPREPEPRAWVGHDAVAELLVTIPPTLEIVRGAAEQFLAALPMAGGPVAFELVGGLGQVRCVLTCRCGEEDDLSSTARAYFPDVYLSRATGLLLDVWNEASRWPSLVVEFGLANEFMIPLHVPTRFDVEPLAGAVAALGDLCAGEAGVLQLLFVRPRAPWGRAIEDTVLDLETSPFCFDQPEAITRAREKTRQPLFACVLRLGLRANPDRALSALRRVTASFNLLADPQGNHLIPLTNSGYSPADHAEDLLRRRTRRSGMLLGLDELASLAHFPSRSVRDARLIRQSRRSRAAPTTGAAGVVVGTNFHENHDVEVRLTAEQRSRHMHLIGASGTGKSTLLLNLIQQDLEQGGGLALFDPHGDLVDHVLGLVPEHRLDDVILIDPADAECPVGFNVLSAHSELEKTLLASDLVSLFQRFATSWGDQMTAVLGNAVMAFLEHERGGTLFDLRRFLVEPAFRKRVLSGVGDAEVRYFWEHEYPLLRGHPQAPILTRLNAFLRAKPIRRMVGQKDQRLDLRRVMDEGKVLLCRLSHGAIGEENAYLLGTLLVSRLQQTAMSRQDVGASQRRPFHLYLDEFQHFVTPSLAGILSGARKYGLGLVLAHQELRQLQSRSADVLAAVLANPAIRVCFRVGDDDAATLAKGFAHFDATDLQALGVGEALMRVERADQDFNLRTAPLPPVAPERLESNRARVLANTRERYGMPIERIEALLAPDTPEDRQTPPPSVAVAPPPPAAREAAEPGSRPVPPPPVRSENILPVAEPTRAPMRGRGGPQHTYLQELIRRWADANGWRATLEEEVLDGLGRVDVALRLGDLTVACELAVTTTPEHEVQNIQKCLAASFARVMVVSPERRTLNRIRSCAAETLGESELAVVSFCSPEELFGLLELAAGEHATRATTVRGYRVKARVKAPPPASADHRGDAVTAVIARAMKRLRKGS